MNGSAISNKDSNLLSANYQNNYQKSHRNEVKYSKSRSHSKNKPEDILNIMETANTQNTDIPSQYRLRDINNFDHRLYSGMNSNPTIN